jgi:hypothetical protein
MITWNDFAARVAKGEDPLAIRQELTQKAPNRKKNGRTIPPSWKQDTEGPPRSASSYTTNRSAAGSSKNHTIASSRRMRWLRFSSGSERTAHHSSRCLCGTSRTHSNSSELHTKILDPRQPEGVPKQRRGCLGAGADEDGGECREEARGHPTCGQGHFLYCEEDPQGPTHPVGSALHCLEKGPTAETVDNRRDENNE